ncbi:phosphatase 2C-like domain-containing protein [Fimicolochytrium jonesii]|uniref:phosphatase 2C-like domain-containing protein n=1 Tax=Fimicolochytrium jonesii TaxID=1396493 RepID=UPI0022FDCADD|nr:phosphatase 2C-like domain-containing protein [Fimicolochytrium jonesii]KAI8821832.1 phosphatase 2C-like domain-containing protein [Fimicolochytrium jonesii]
MPLTVSYGASTDIGRRASQQDAFLIHPSAIPSNPHPTYLFIILDGHGSEGTKVAQFVKEQFAAVVAQHAEQILAGDPKTAFTNVFRLVNEKLEDEQSIDTYMSGSTVALVLLVGETLYVAHIGDSRVVLGRTEAQGGLSLRPLTRDHNCTDPGEYERVTKAGARVESLPTDGNTDGPLRIFKGTLPYPGLVVTRTLGDNVARRLGITCEPEVDVVTLTPSDRFLVMATDGVWDGVTDDDIIKAVSSNADATSASNYITQASLAGLDRLSLDDNTTNIVLYFSWQ